MTRYQTAEWLEWSGLPEALNTARAGAWPVFKKLVELDCKTNARPGTVEIALAELAMRCGLPVDGVHKIVEALRKKKYLRSFIPDTPEEPALIEICVPLATPIPPAQVARQCPDPYLRDPHAYRYVTAEDPDQAADAAKAQDVADLYLNLMSQRVNPVVLDQIELAARRFPLAEIRETIERAARHDIRSMSWVLKELVRAARKKREQA
jgi:hypothetical protein